MQAVLRHLDARRAHFHRHPLVRRMRAGEPFPTLLPVVTGLAFWVLSFHDMLALLEADMEAPEFRVAARHHHAEEAGHDRWYFRDLERLGVPVPDTRALFGPAHAGARAASWRLHGLAAYAATDLERLVLILGLEATGAVFFEAAAAYPGWPRRDLQFFSAHHLDVEKGHALFEARLQAWVEAMQVSPEALPALILTVDRIFDAFVLMFDAFERQVAAAAAAGAEAAAGDGAAASA